MGELIRDIRIGARSLIRRPGFTLVAVLTLALGIGANTAIYSFVDSLLFRPMPFAEADRLVRVYAVPRADASPTSLSIPEMDEMTAARIFAAIGGFSGSQYNFSGRGQPEEVKATIATRTLFDVLGVKPVVGDVWPETNDRTRSFVVMLTYDFWVRRFNADASVVGTPLTMDGAQYTIAGILPRGFTYPTTAEIFRCWGIAPSLHTWRHRGVAAVARLHAGRTIEQAQADLDGLAQRLGREHPDTHGGARFMLRPLRDAYVGDVRPYLLLLFGAAALVLLVACVNIANLLLSRQLGRTGEFAIRSALGASRARLIRQMVAESVLLALTGAALGVLLAFAGLRLLRTLVGLSLPAWMTIQIDHRVLLFTLLITMATGLLCGIVPAWRLSRLNLQDDLKEGARGSSSRQQGLRAALIVAEVALSCVLLVGASLLLQSLLRIHQNQFGLPLDNTLTFRVALPWMTYDKPRMFAFHERALDALRQTPGIADAALTSTPPLSSVSPDLTSVLRPEDDPGRSGPEVILQRVSHNYHEMMGIPLVRGRLFGDEDRVESPPAAILSRQAVRLLFRDAEPLGRRLNVTPTGKEPTWATVVGVVGDVRPTATAAEPGPDVYVSARQTALLNAAYIVRTRAATAVSREELERAVHKVDPNQSIYDVLSLRQRMIETVWQRRLAAVLFVGFAGLALLLAAVGLYGVIAFWVGERRREMGIRLALGASRASVIRLVMRQGLRLAAAGIVLGSFAAVALGRTASSLLFNTSPVDPLTFVGVPLLLLATAALAALLPAVLATRVSLVSTLREK